LGGPHAKNSPNENPNDPIFYGLDQSAPLCRPLKICAAYETEGKELPMFGRPKNSISALEGKLASLQKRSLGFERDLAAAATNVDDARRRYGDMWLKMDEDENTFVSVEATINAAEVQKCAVEKRLEEIERHIIATKQDLTKARDTAERQRLHDDLVKRAETIDKVATNFTDACAAVEATYRDLVHSLQKNGTKLSVDTDAEKIARCALITSIEQIEPGLVAHLRLHRYFPSGSNGADEIRRTTDKMREFAANIKRGAKEAVKPPTLEPQMPDFKATLPTVKVCFTKPVVYNDEHGVRQRHAAWTAEVPVTLAETAEKAGIAIRLDSDEGQQKFERYRKNRRGPIVSNGATVSYFSDELVQIEIDLPALLKAELDRLRQEWLKVQQSAA
jgi:hypothetical protein